MTLVLRVDGRSATALAGAVRGEIAAMDERLTTGALAVMDDLVAAQYAQRRFLLVLFGVFAGLAATVAGVGIYGTTAYTVAQRRRELGVRMALGAGSAHVRRLVLRQGVGLAALGVAGGLAAAAALVGLMERLLFETEAANPLVFLGVAALLLMLAGAASYLPARRATRLDPLSVLRDAS
jgi:putative ABC transport system permease protein